MKTLTILTSKKREFFLFLSMILLLSTMFLITHEEPTRYLYIAMTLVFIYLTLRSSLSANRPTLFLMPDTFSWRVRGVNEIPWHDVIGVRMQKKSGFEFVVVKIKFPEKYVSGQKWVAKLNYLTGSGILGDEISIPMWNLEISGCTLLREIEKRAGGKRS